MYGKLILQNLKRSLRDYLVYFLTLALCVGLFYGFLSISSRHFQASVPVEYNLEMMKESVKYAVIAVGLLLVFLIRYANRHILGRKLKEIALLTLTGMDQRLAAYLFFCETILIGLAAIGLGVLLGLLFSQIVTVIVLHFYGLSYAFYFSLYPDTLLITLLLFIMLFFLVGLENIRTIRKSRIINMLDGGQRIDADYKTEKNIAPWVMLADIGALYLCGFGWYGFYRGSAQEFQTSLLFDLFWGASAPALFLLVSARYFWNIVRKRAASHWVALLAGMGLISAVGSLRLYRLLHMTDLYPIIAALFFAFSVFAFFDCLCGLLLWAKERYPRLRYRNLFLLGQMTAKLKNSSRTMGVLSIVLLGAMVSLAFAQPLAESKSLYQASRITTDFAVVDRWWLSDSMEDLPKTDFSFDFVDAYLTDGGYTVEDSATVKFYFLDDADFNKRGSSGAPAQEVALGVTLSEYNHMRRMTGYPEIALREGQFALHCGLGNAPDMADVYLKRNRTLSIGGEKITYSGDAFYENVGEFMNDSYNSPTIVLPDAACTPLTVAEVKYFGITSPPLSNEYAELFYRDMSKKIQTEGLLKTAPKNPLVWTKADQVNESVMWAVTLTLTLSYLGVVLLVICFTILSLQQISDSWQNRRRFQILRRLGVEETGIRRLILQQTGIWFGIPLCFSLLGVAAIFPVIMRQASVAAFVGPRSLIVQVGFAVLLLFILLLCYFMATVLMFERNVERRN